MVNGNTYLAGTNKGQVPYMYQLIYEVLSSKSDHRGFISFKDSRYLLGCNFHIKYKNTYRIFSELESFGLANIVSFRGLILRQNKKQKSETLLRCIL